MKTIAFIILITFTFSSISFGAKDGSIFFNVSTASKLVGDLKYCNQTIKDQGTLLNNCKNLNTISEKEIQTLKEMSATQRTDIDLVIKAKDEYKELYVKTNNELIKEREDKPSRFTWFCIGGLTALILGIAAALATK